MSTISLGYGKSAIEYSFDDERFEILGGADNRLPLTDFEIGQRLDDPVGSGRIEDIVAAGESLLIVVPDATRNIGCGQIVNILVRRLIAGGVLPYDINIIFATGIHRSVTKDEKRRILTPFVFQRVKTLDHDARDLMQFLRLGETPSGIPVELNKKLTEFDHAVIIGGINFHYFAGFTGGRKLICPGLASSKTIAQTHKLAFDCDTLDRRAGVGPGQLDGNPVHDAFVEVVNFLPPSFGINTIVDENGKIIDLKCGDWQRSHRAACDAYAADHTLRIKKKRQLVIVSSGGSPHDLNLIQAHKALDMASHACTPGGTIIFIAECPDGPGRGDFLEWFDAPGSREMGEMLCRNYKVNLQTAWSLRKKAEEFEIRIVTELSDNDCRKLGLRKIAGTDLIAIDSTDSGTGYILPFGAKYRIDAGHTG